MGKRLCGVLASAPLLLVLVLAPNPARGQTVEPRCAEVACRVCPVVMEATALVTGDEPGYCAA